MRHTHFFPLTLIALSVATALTGCEAADDSVFAIRPYPVSIGGRGVAIGWQYQESVEKKYGAGRAATLELLRDGAVFATLPTTKTAGYRAAVLPFPCGWGSGVSYKVTGMSWDLPLDPLPCPDPEGSVRFSFITDTQQGPDHVKALAAEIARFPGAALLHGGDIVQTGGKLSEWFKYFDAMDVVGASRVTVAAIGNHEYRQGGDKLFSRFMGIPAVGAHYVWRTGPVDVFVINSCFEDDDSFKHTQAEWLARALADSTAPWKIVSFHHTPYSRSIGHHPLFASKKEHIDIRDHYEPHFRAYGVDLVLSGHVHLYERGYKDGVHYINGGPAGGVMGVKLAKSDVITVSLRERTVTHVDAAPEGLAARTFTAEGEEIDALRLEKPAAPPLASR
ncbi:MAG: metallophosphoesterase [Bdellovibrionales bacterium]|nr:metallophosphoesterase [Bdellovibrionales bacterium]